MTETFKLLTESYGEDCMSRARVFEWHKRFLEGRESVKDDDCPGCPRTAYNIEKVRDVIQKDRRLCVRAVAEEVNLDRESIWRILNLLSDEQKEHHMELCLDLLQCIENKPDLLNSIITCDETWVFTYDRETKRQSMQWKSSSPRPKKARMSRLKFKAMWIVFFDIQGIVISEWVPMARR